MPKILITGSNGLLGEHLIQLLRGQKDDQLVATARGENRWKDQEGYTFQSMDICNKENVNRVMADEKPDYVIHGAAMTQVDQCEEEKADCWETNVLATHYLMKAAKEIGAFFIFISTDFIFDGADGPYPENFIPNPLSYYGTSKLAAEMLLKGSELSFTILRTVLVYGVSENPARSNLVLWVKKSLESGEKINVVDDQWRTPTLVQDLAEGCRLVIENRKKGKTIASVYNISGKELLTPYQMALKVAQHFKLDSSLIKRADASNFTQKAKRPAKTGFILDKAEQELDYRPHSFEEGLAVVEEKLINQSTIL